MKKLQVTLDDDTQFEVVAGKISGTADVGSVVATVFGEMNVNQKGGVRTLLDVPPGKALSKFIYRQYEGPK